MAKTRVHRLLRASRARVGRLVRAAQDRVLGPVYARLPLDPTLVVYTSLWHRSPRGNPLAVYEAQQRLAPHLTARWIVRRQDAEDLPEGIVHVEPRSLAALRLAATAAVIVDDANPYWPTPQRPGQRYVQTHHGTALKYMGADRHYSGDRPSDATLTTMHRRAQRWTHSIAPSPYLADVWRRAYQNDCQQIAVGFPRNDALIEASPARREAARTRLGLSASDTAVLYMPTWRTRSGPDASLLDLADLAARLPADTSLLVRDHYFHDAAARGDLPTTVRDVSAGWDVEDLYLASDLLITDYSSAMYDYALLDRPIILLCPDWEEYRTARGAYYDVTRDAPGEVVRGADALVQSLRSGTYADPSFASARANYRSRFSTYEDGRAAETVVRVVMLGEDSAIAGTCEPAQRPLGWTEDPPVRRPDRPSREPRPPAATTSRVRGGWPGVG